MKNNNNELSVKQSLNRKIDYIQASVSRIKIYLNKFVNYFLQTFIGNVLTKSSLKITLSNKNIIPARTSPQSILTEKLLQDTREKISRTLSNLPKNFNKKSLFLNRRSSMEKKPIPSKEIEYVE